MILGSHLIVFSSFFFRKHLREKTTIINWATNMNKVGFALIIILLFSSVLIVTSEPGVVSAASSSAIIRIRTDGTIEGTNKIQQNGLIYTLTADISGSVESNEAFIFIEKDNIVFDGAGYTIEGSGKGTAIYMLRSRNVSIQNCQISNFETGINFWMVTNWPSNSSYIGLPSASKNKIINNSIEVVGDAFSNSSKEAGWCLYLSDAVDTTILDNQFNSQDHKGGIYFAPSTTRTNLSNNTFIGCGIYSTTSTQTTASGNLVDGKSLVYLEGQSNKIIEGAGLVYLFNCDNIVIKNIKPTYNYGTSIQLVETRNSEILACRGYVVLTNSSNNTIHDNNLNSLQLVTSTYNRIFANKITYSSISIKLSNSANYNEIYSNTLCDTVYSAEAEAVHNSGFNTAGIQLGDINEGGTQFNNIHHNTLYNHDCALEFFLSSNNTITSNVIINCKAGIQLGNSNQNNITQNNVTSCKYGISIYAASSNNTFYYNNLINNQVPCFETHQQTILSTGNSSYSIGNSWDNGKTGNYWDAYQGVDQNSDGIGDIAYNVFDNMYDNYPLMAPFAITSGSNGSTTKIPEADLTSLYPSPSNQGDNQGLINTETIVIIVAVSLIIGIIGGVLVYFRRLIFR